MKNVLRVAVVLWTLLWALPGLLRAEVIHLKDGTTITATAVSENNDQVSYTSNGAQHSVEKSTVGSIDRSDPLGITIGTAKSGWIAAPAHPGVAVSSESSAPKLSHNQLAATLPKEPSMRGVDLAALSAHIVNQSGVNQRVLHEVEAEGNPAKSAAGYFIAARYSYEHSDAEAARGYLKRCVELQPEQAGLREWYSVLLLEAGQTQEAVTQAERAAKLQPNSADALQVLGVVYYDSGRFGDALETWKRAQEKQPSQAIAALIEKAKREAGVEGNFNEREGAHFVLRFEGRQTGFRFASELLSSLERNYGSMQRELGAPEITITVIVYTEKQFFDASGAPSWSDGLNDGKIRVPVHDLSGVTPQLESVLRHEMAHSFVHALTRGRCPTWLNEGIAQMEQERSTSEFAEPLAQLFRAGKAVPLRYLEGSFMGLNSQQAGLAYAESLAATEYLRSAYGMRAVREMLDALGGGEMPESALRRAAHVNYEEFESGIGSYLAHAR
jgi:tetratricopeptide (TPR) repeat protein